MFHALNSDNIYNLCGILICEMDKGAQRYYNSNGYTETIIVDNDGYCYRFEFYFDTEKEYSIKHINARNIWRKLKSVGWRVEFFFREVR